MFEPSGEALGIVRQTLCLFPAGLFSLRARTAFGLQEEV